MTTARRICLIDDDTFARNALTLALEDAGYQVVSAPGAAAGFDAVRRNGADAIVTDMNMPGTDGAELITQARAAWPKMPIVAINVLNRHLDGFDKQEVDAVKHFLHRLLASGGVRIPGAEQNG